MSTINTNVQSLNAQRNLAASSGALSTSMQRLSSGLRVNSAKDDAAGLAIAERMNAQVKGMNVAIRNANDGISLAQTAEGALGKVGDSLQRMRELAVQSANGSNSDDDRTNLDAEYQQLALEVTRVLEGTKFNGQNLFDGTGGVTGTFTFQVGANNDTTDQIDVEVTDLTADTDMTAATGSDITTLTDAQGALDLLDTAIDTITTTRAELGAVQNRFDSVISNLQVAAENEASARGRIVDADFAKETANLSRGQILQQAGTAMIAQANQLPQGVLSLLR
ncbi:flagellin domain-containing protein [Hydrogenophaga sp.]|uniref:flagellin domain-containing protein n=1 Tax=Hydrogenophaga sp. TaxID=1904254 RepID=UPI003F6BED94